MSAQPAPTPDSKPTPAENPYTESRLEELHRENPLVKLFSLFGKLFFAVGSLRYWPKLNRRQRVIALSAVSGSAITVTFLCYEFIQNVSKFLPQPESIPLYEISPTDANLEKHDQLWHVAPTDAWKVNQGTENDGQPKQIAAGASAEFRPESERRLADFDGVFELIVRAIPQSSTWVLRQDREEGSGYRFRLHLPAVESGKAKFEAHLLASGGEQAGSCVTQGSAYGGIIQPGHVLRVTVHAQGNNVNHEFMLASANPEIAHEQADGRTVAVRCRFPQVAPPGFIGFHAVAGQLAIRNFRLCAPSGAKHYSSDCLERQD